MKQLFIVLFVVVAGLLMASCSSGPQQVEVVRVLEPVAVRVVELPPPPPLQVLPVAHNPECESLLRR